VERAAGTLMQRLRAAPVMDPRFLFFIFILLPVRTLFAHQWLTMPDYVTRCFDADIGKRFEWIGGINPLVIVIFVPLITAFTQRVHVLTMMIVGSTITALSTFLLVGEPSLTLLIAYTVLFSLGEAAWSSRFLEYVADLAPAGRVGAYMGLAMLPWFVAKFTTGFYSGAMIEAFIPKEGAQDPGTLWFIYGLIALLSPLGLVLARRWLRRGIAAPA
jgi:dipeptide/tripeptide permease